MNDRAAGAGGRIDRRAAFDAVALTTRSALRRRWPTFALLGLLFGLVAGAAIAGWAGAGRGERAVRTFSAVSDDWQIALVPNDPTFTPADRATIARLPGVRRAEPFSIAFVVAVVDGVERQDFWPGLVPTPEPQLPVGAGGPPLVTGRPTDPASTDEVVIDQVASRAYGLDVGDRMALRSDATDPSDMPLTVVGIVQSTSATGGGSWTPSAGFIAAHPDLPHITNLALWLEPGTDATELATRAAAAVGRADIPFLDQRRDTRQQADTVSYESAATRLWAVVVALAGCSLVGQALVRSVSATGRDLDVLRELGMGRTARRIAAAGPSVVTLGVAVVVAVLTAIVASTRFPVGLARGFLLDDGPSVDWSILAIGVLMTAGTVVALAALGARRAGEPRPPRRNRPGRAAVAALRMPLPLTVRLGLRATVDGGRAGRAVPIRSTLAGLTVGVAGVTAAFTFQAGLHHLVGHPSQAGANSDVSIQPEEELTGVEEAKPEPDAIAATLAAEPTVAAATRATWHRALLVEGISVSSWTFDPVVGAIAPTVLAGRLPAGDDEIALAPETFRTLHTHVGDTVRAGPGSMPMRVVGEVLLPDESHQGYASGGYLTPGAFVRSGQTDAETAGGFVGFFVRYEPSATDAQRALLSTRLAALGWVVRPTAIPFALARLHGAPFLSLQLAVFLAVLGAAVLAHALVLTVRRRRHDLAVLRALGLSRRAVNGVVAGQASTFAVAGTIIGLPVGMWLGRRLWRLIIDTYSFLYIAPGARTLAATVALGAVVLANVVALAPAWMARRISVSARLAAE